MAMLISIWPHSAGGAVLLEVKKDVSKFCADFCLGSKSCKGLIPRDKILVFHLLQDLYRSIGMQERIQLRQIDYGNDAYKSSRCENS